MTEPVTIGIDIGGSGIKGLLLNPGTGSVLLSQRVDTPVADGVEKVTATVAAMATRLAAEAKARSGVPPVGVGVVVPGIVDEPAGVVRSAVNLGFLDVPLAAELTAATGLPVRLGHDVRAGGLAEARFGAGHGEANVLFVPLGTGIAAGCVVDGRLLTAGGYAGELGHVVVVPGGEPCPCGQSGCLERYSSAAAVARRYTDRTGTWVSGAADVVRRVAAGDGDAAAVLDEAVQALATALLLAITLLGSAVVVIGGGLAGAGPSLMVPLEAELEARMTFHRRPRLVVAQLGDEAGAIGAALLAADAVARIDGGVA
jgi:glucokinase